jgi:feruloyl esterase
LAGKEVVKSFYGKPHARSYFLGCSQGGRQGIGSAEKYPNDFDGIVAGAPALDFNNMIAWRASIFPITGRVGSPNFISPATWTGLIHDEVMKQCDVIDGVKDGIIEYPDLCRFRPEVLQCKEDNTSNCLSPRQIAQVQRIFSPFRHSDGTLIYPGMLPGSEVRAIDRLYAGKPFSDSQVCWLSGALKTI